MVPDAIIPARTSGTMPSIVEEYKSTSTCKNATLPGPFPSFDCCSTKAGIDVFSHPECSCTFLGKSVGILPCVENAPAGVTPANGIGRPCHESKPCTTWLYRHNAPAMRLSECPLYTPSSI